MTATFTFEDGTTITGLETTDYRWYSSDAELDTDLLLNNVFLVTITEGDIVSTIVDRSLAKSKEEDGKYYYRLCEKTAADFNDAIMVDMDYRLTLLELGVTE